MVHEFDKYTYRVMWSEEDEEFVGLCAEFLGLSWLESAPETALKGIRSLVIDCIEDMKNNNESIPEPIAMKNYSGEFMVRVSPEVHRHLAIEAAEHGVGLDRVVSAKLTP